MTSIGTRKSSAPSWLASSPPISAPAPWESPHRLIARPRRRGETKSLITEKPIEATLPRPTATIIW